MNVTKRAFLYLTRKKGKTISLFAFLLVMATMILTCISIQSAAKEATLNVRKALMGSFTINAKRLQTGLTKDTVDKILSLNSLSGNYLLRSYTQATFFDESGNALEIKTEGAATVPNGYEHAGKVVANSDSDKDTYFTQAGFKLIEGRAITSLDRNVVLIHQEFAKRNHLSVGDTMLMGNIEDKKIQVKVTIQGIFTNTKEQDSLGMTPSHDLYDNIVLTDIATSSYLIFAKEGQTCQYGDFYVNNPDELDTIIETVKLIPNVSWQDCVITKYDKDYQNAKNALMALQDIVFIALVAITVICFVVLSLILTFSLRNRVHEIGVILAMGVSKKTILIQQLLLEKAYMVQLLSESELEKIQFDCLALLAKKTERFNSGDSSSIRIEKAQDILASIMFTIGASLKKYPNPDDAVAAVQYIGVEAVYTEGRKQIDKLLEQARMLHRSLVSHLVQSKNVFYSSTIVDGINGFFKLYDAEFASQEIHITADYPVYNKAERLLGIEFIEQYLKQLYYENLFCTHFSDEDIHHLLCGYDERYENLLLNIYEPVLAAALGCVIADAPANTLEITPEIQSFLYHQFAGKVHTEIEQILENAVSKFAESLSFSDSLTAYVQQGLPQLTAAIEIELKVGNLERVFITPMYPEDNPKLTISFGEKMDDARYRKVLNMFMSCGSTTDKIIIMKNEIHTLADLEDLLLDAELSAYEMMVILKSLSPSEIVALMKKYRPAYEMSFTELRSCEKILCECLHGFVASLPPEQQMLFEKAVKALEVDEYEQ